MRVLLPAIGSIALLAGCGSSPASSSASALETMTGEQELASATIAEEADDDEDRCYCPKVTVRCGKSAGFHARADRASCTLDLPPRSCALFGLETGDKAHPEAMLAAAAPAELSAEDVYELCTAKHEAHHACDRAMDGSLCAFELPAYDLSLECMRPFASDPRVAHQIEGVIAAREMNACLCAGTECDSCVERCKTDHPGFGATCKQAEAVYCR